LGFITLAAGLRFRHRVSWICALQATRRASSARLPAGLRAAVALASDWTSASQSSGTQGRWANDAMLSPPLIGALSMPRLAAVGQGRHSVSGCVSFERSHRAPD
jgi:hypothetical protein